VTRLAVAGIFTAAAVVTALDAFDHLEAAVTASDARSWALAGYWVLRTAVIAAFAFFVAVRSDARAPSRDPVAFVACTAALASMVMLHQPSAAADTAMVLVGDLVALVSYVWLVVSVFALGRCFGILPEARGLVTHGPYRLVRHPVYAGEMGAVVGFLIGAPSSWNLIATAIFFVAQGVRMRLEERALQSEFPEYGEYAAVTPRLLPTFSRHPGRRLLAAWRTP
jgi:protein-S-isoprenylcysteine O-methyltransferase Ste14